MKSLIWFLIPSLALSGCSDTEPEEEAGEPIVLAVDCTVEALTGKGATASGRDFFHAVSRLVALGSSVELRIRDDVGWMDFLLPYDWNPHGVKVDMMHARFQADGVILNDARLGDAEFAKRIDQYGKAFELLDSQGLIIVEAEQGTEIGDCVKYLRVIYDAGIDQFVLPPPDSYNEIDQRPSARKKVLKSVP